MGKKKISFPGLQLQPYLVAMVTTQHMDFCQIKTLGGVKGRRGFSISLFSLLNHHVPSDNSLASLCPPPPNFNFREGKIFGLGRRALELKKVGRLQNKKKQKKVMKPRV